MISVMSEHVGFGVDVGGSGVKAGLVDLNSGELIGDRQKLLTPKPATPDAVAETVRTLVESFGWEGPVGIALPAVIINQTARSAANIDPSWIDTDCTELFSRYFPGRKINVLNDADAAGLAEVEYGAAAGAKGNVIMLTLGTGIGSALITDGKLYSNTELGHLVIKGTEAEHLASSSAKDRDGISYKKWAKRLTKVLNTYEALLSPSTFVLGGGVSRKAEKWMPYLEVDTEVVVAQLANTAGIVGAAIASDTDLAP